MPDQKQPTDKSFDMHELAAIMAEVNEKCRAVVEKFVEKQQFSKGIDEANANSIRESFQELATKLMDDPSQLFNQQQSYWNDYWSLVRTNMLQFWGQPSEPAIEPEKGEKEFDRFAKGIVTHIARKKQPGYVPDQKMGDIWFKVE